MAFPAPLTVIRHDNYNTLSCNYNATTECLLNVQFKLHQPQNGNIALHREAPLKAIFFVYKYRKTKIFCFKQLSQRTTISYWSYIYPEIGEYFGYTLLSQHLHAAAASLPSMTTVLVPLCPTPVAVTASVGIVLEHCVISYSGPPTRYTNIARTSGLQLTPCTDPQHIP